MSEKTLRRALCLLCAALLLSWTVMVLPAAEKHPTGLFEEADSLQPEPLSSKRSSGFVEQTPPPEEQETENTESQQESVTLVQEGEAGEEGEGESTSQGPTFMTNLGSYTQSPVLVESLSNHILPFYVTPTGGEGLSVKLRSDSGVLAPVSGDNYEATLSLGSNRITVLLYQDGELILDKRYTILYQEREADENNPRVGEQPPEIYTNLEDGERLTNQNFTLLVSAKDGEGHWLERTGSSLITVLVDGVACTQVTGGSAQYEYALYFRRPNIGDTRTVEIEIRANDGKGSSSYLKRRITVEFPDEEQTTGTASVYIDATAIGQGILDGPYSYTIKQGVPAADAVLECLEQCGYTAEYSGSVKLGFYLHRIRRAGINEGGEVPPHLWEIIQRDGLSLSNSYDPDSIGEWDYTSGSGWMYTVNGALFPGKGMSEWYLNDGDALYLRFSLAYGKDIGGYDSTGGSYGSFSSYCYRWVDGAELPQGHWMEEVERIEPTESEEGYVLCVCRRCGETEEEWLPALGIKEE